MTANVSECVCTELRGDMKDRLTKVEMKIDKLIWMLVGVLGLMCYDYIIKPAVAAILQ